jgi:hypothetical protein
MIFVLLAEGFGLHELHGQMLNQDEGMFSPGTTDSLIYSPYLEGHHLDTDNKSPFVPDHYKFQFTRKGGYLAIGAGYNILNVFEPTFSAGYMRLSDYNNTISSVVLSLKNSFYILGNSRLDNTSLKAGMSLLYAASGNQEHKTSSQSNGSTSQDMLQLAPFLGMEWRINQFRRGTASGGIFIEITTLDTHLKDLFNSKFVSFDEIWALSLGITIYPTKNSKGKNYLLF